ncbi:MAG: alkaline phosphatase family protein [bacterium]
MKLFISIVTFAVILASLSIPVSDRFYLQSPAGERFTHIDVHETTILPNSRLLTPAGKQILIAPHPFGMTLTPDGKVLVTVNGGVGPFSISIIRNPEDDAPIVTQIPQSAKTENKILPSAFIGVAVDDVHDLVYVSGGDSGSIYVFRLSNTERLKEININSDNYPDSYTTDIALSADGKWLYVLDLANYRMVIIDTLTSQVVSSIKVGRNPFALVLTNDGKKAYLANMGTFQYSLVETREQDDKRGITFPAFGYPSKKAEQGTITEGRKVPGLGDPNVPESCSVWGIDISNPMKPKVSMKLKTGLPIGQAIGGSSPAGLAVTQDALYVSNSMNDTIESYDLKTLQRKWRTLLTPVPFLRRLRGVIPFGLALSPDGKRLYVAESGINAVGILETKTGKILGHIPVGWYPAQVNISPNGKYLYVSNAKGFGSGPNGGMNFKPGPEGSYIGKLMKGTVSIISIPSDALLKSLTNQVILNNGFFSIARQSDGLDNQEIKYVVFITKENRTFDEVFGDMPNVFGDTSLARFGANRSIDKYDNITVMPSHRTLAKQFTFSDNFYVDSDVSADGHRWLVGVYANHWVESMVAASYGGGVTFKKSKAPGRLALFESNSSMTPEDYNEHGSLWEHLEEHRIPFRNYGEGFEFAGISEAENTKPTGARLPVNIPMPDPLFENTCREYPTFNMNIPDQYRADRFIHEFNSIYDAGKKPLPRFINLYLPNDHGAKSKPEKGYPYLESYMMDNDLALGRIIETLSHSRFWKNMAIIITEDDAQSGVDHIDAHRSLVMVVSPWAKRGYVSHQHTSIASIMKTIYRILDIPSLNLYDAAANDLSDMFTQTPDFQPYQLQPIDTRIFDSEKARDPNDPEYRKAAKENELELDSMAEAMRQLGYPE